MKRFSFFVAGASALPPHRVSVMILSVSGNTIVLEWRNGTTVTVDLTEALAMLPDPHRF